MKFLKKKATPKSQLSELCIKVLLDLETLSFSKEWVFEEDTVWNPNLRYLLIWRDGIGKTGRLAWPQFTSQILTFEEKRVIFEKIMRIRANLRLLKEESDRETAYKECRRILKTSV